MAEQKKGMDKMTKGFLIFIGLAFIILTFTIVLGDHSYELKGAAKANTASAQNQGSANRSGSPEFQPYLEEMHKQISGKWQPPAVNKDSEVILRFTILKNGHVIDEQVAQSSGDKRVDESALAALRKASPLPPLPLSFSKDSITVNFNFVVRANSYEE
jgi:TonB family protein